MVNPVDPNRASSPLIRGAEKASLEGRKVHVNSGSEEDEIIKNLFPDYVGPEVPLSTEQLTKVIMSFGDIEKKKIGTMTQETLEKTRNAVSRCVLKSLPSLSVGDQQKVVQQLATIPFDTFLEPLCQTYLRSDRMEEFIKLLPPFSLTEKDRTILLEQYKVPETRATTEFFIKCITLGVDKSFCKGNVDVINYKKNKLFEELENTPSLVQAVLKTSASLDRYPEIFKDPSVLIFLTKDVSLVSYLDESIKNKEYTRILVDILNNSNSQEIVKKYQDFCNEVLKSPDSAFLWSIPLVRIPLLFQYIPFPEEKKLDPDFIWETFRKAHGIAGFMSDKQIEVIFKDKDRFESLLQTCPKCLKENNLNNLQILSYLFVKEGRKKSYFLSYPDKFDLVHSDTFLSEDILRSLLYHCPLDGYDLVNKIAMKFPEDFRGINNECALLIYNFLIERNVQPSRNEPLWQPLEDRIHHVLKGPLKDDDVDFFKNLKTPIPGIWLRGYLTDDDYNTFLSRLRDRGVLVQDFELEEKDRVFQLKQLDRDFQEAQDEKKLDAERQEISEFLLTKEREELLSSDPDEEFNTLQSILSIFKENDIDVGGFQTEKKDVGSLQAKLEECVQQATEKGKMDEILKKIKKFSVEQEEEKKSLNLKKKEEVKDLSSLLTDRCRLSKYGEERITKDHPDLLTHDESVRFLKYVTHIRLLQLKEKIDQCEIEDDFEISREIRDLIKTKAEREFFLGQLHKKPIQYDMNNFDRPLLELSGELQKEFSEFRKRVPKEVVGYLNYIDERGINDIHRSGYGDYDQSLYIKHCKLLALYTVFACEKNISSREVIMKVGSGRRIFAKLTRNEDATYFGTLRKDAVHTPLVGSYKAYGYRAQKISSQDIGYRIHSRYKGLDTQFGTTAILTGMANLTKMNENAWNKITELLDKAREKPSPSFQELGERIGLFHWYFAQMTPFKRGSAAVAEIITDALWLYHGYIRKETNILESENRVSPDLEALVPEDGPEIREVPDPEHGPDATKKEYPEDRYQKKYTSFWKEYQKIEKPDWASELIPKTSK